MTDLAAQDEQAVDHASQLEREIRLGCKAIRAAWVLLASRLYEFHDTDGWRLLGYDTFDEWMAGPDIDLERRHTYRLIEAYRELVVERNISPGALELVDVTKIAVVLPAVKRGDVTPDEALSDAQELSRSDLTDKYVHGASQGFSAEHEPARHDCPECGQSHKVKTASGGDLE